MAELHKQSWGVLTACLLGVCSLPAQETQPAFRPDTDPVQLGIEASVNYTDNRDCTREKESNVDLLLGPRIDGLFDYQRTLIDLFYVPSVRYRTNPGDDQNESELYHDLGLNANASVSPRFEAWLNEKFNRTDDPAISQEGSVTRTDSSFNLNDLRLGGKYKVSPLTSGMVDAGYRTKFYDDDEVARQADEDAWTGGFSVWQQPTRTLAVFIRGGVIAYRYDDESDVDRGSTEVAGILGVEQVFSAGLRASARAGWGMFEFEDETIDSLGAPLADVSLEMLPNPGTKIRANAGYQVRDADVYPFASQEEMSFTATLERDLEGPFRFAVDVSYRSGLYDTDTLSQVYQDRYYNDPAFADYVADLGFDGSGSEDRLQAAVEVAYEFDRMTSVKFRQRFEDVTSDVSETFNRNDSSLVVQKRF